jgi:hypothetical protein
MSIIQIAVDNHLKVKQVSMRDLLRAAYMKRFGREIPPKSLEEDLISWSQGHREKIPYLLDFMLGEHGATF